VIGESEVVGLDSTGRVWLSPRNRAAAGIGLGDWVEFLVLPGSLVLRKVTVAPVQAGAPGATGHVDRRDAQAADDGSAGYAPD